MDQCISYNGGTTEVYHSTYKILQAQAFIVALLFTSMMYHSFSKIESLRNFSNINDCLMTHGIYVSKNAKGTVLTLTYILILLFGFRILPYRIRRCL